MAASVRLKNGRASKFAMRKFEKRRFAVHSLEGLGWCEYFSSQYEASKTGSEFIPARVAEENRETYRTVSATGEVLCELSGKFRHEIQSRADFPAVGDWVLASLRENERRGTIHRVLKRSSKFSRKSAGRKTEEQIVAANIDVIFLVSSLNREFNPRRIERYLTLAWESGAKPVIVLNKCDLCENPDQLCRQAESAAMGVRVILASAFRGDGIAAIREMLRAGFERPGTGLAQASVTAAMLGSSGVGKSSLINAILATPLQETKSIREGDDRGRHTTTTRQLIVIPGGGVLIDTPGMRELQLWDASEGIGHAFSEIQGLAARCKFRDCKHESEPGCAVRAAVESEALDAERLESFHKLGREEKFLEAKQDAALRSQRTKDLRKMMKSVNQFYRDRGR
jgi:ribosome biogenesis GTPase / thiamine phosphate phosphatase